MLRERYKTSELFKRARIDNNLSQQAISEKLDIQQGYFSLLERGLAKPSLGMVLRLKNAFGLPWEFIEGFIDE